MGKEILFIDDDESIRDVLSELFEAENLLVHFAADGQQALEILAQLPEVSLAIVDIFMPRMNGVAFIKECQQKYPQLKLYVLTGTPNLTEIGINLPAHIPIIGKPCHLEELVQQIKQTVA